MFMRYLGIGIGHKPKGRQAMAAKNVSADGNPANEEEFTEEPRELTAYGSQDHGSDSDKDSEVAESAVDSGEEADFGYLESSADEEDSDPDSEEGDSKGEEEDIDEWNEDGYAPL
jgi:hypothetical protein